MLKKDELTDPNSCLNRAKDDEMVFTLLARDEAAPKIIRKWIDERIRIGKNKWDDPQIRDAYECSLEMERQRKEMTDAQNR